MLGATGWRGNKKARWLAAFVILSWVPVFLFSGCGTAGGYGDRCPRGQYWSQTAEQCVDFPGP